MARSLLCCFKSSSLFVSQRGEHGANFWDQRVSVSDCALQVSSSACWNKLTVSNRRQVERVTDSNVPGSRPGNIHRRFAHSEHGSTADSQIIDIEAKIREVETNEDEEEIKGQNVEKNFKSQFERLAKAMATNDEESAEQILQELGDPLKVSEMKVMMDGANEMEDELKKLHSEVSRIIEEGDLENARRIVEENYNALVNSLGDVVPPGVEQAAMLDILAQLRLSLGDTNEAEKLLEQIERILENSGAESNVAMLENILNHLGNMYKTLGQPAKAVPAFESSLQIQENTLGEDSPLIIRLLMGLAATYLENDEEEKAIETFQRVVATIERISGPNDDQLVLPLAEMGHILLEVERFDEAEAALLRSLQITEQVYGPEHWQTGCATCSVARAKTAKGEFLEAESLYRKGLQCVESSTDFPENEDEILMSKTNIRGDLAELLDALQRYDEAQELWRSNLEEKEKELGEEDVELTPTLLGLASSFQDAEKYDQAEPLLRRSLKLLTNQFGPDALETSEAIIRLATVLHYLRKDKESEVLARQALRIRESTYGPYHPSTAEACNTLASILNAFNQCEESLALMQRVLRIYETEYGADSLELAVTLELIITLLDKLDRKSEIFPLLLRLENLMESKGSGLDLQSQSGSLL